MVYLKIIGNPFILKCKNLSVALEKIHNYWNKGFSKTIEVLNERKQLITTIPPQNQNDFGTGGLLGGRK